LLFARASQWKHGRQLLSGFRPGAPSLSLSSDRSEMNNGVPCTIALSSDTCSFPFYNRVSCSPCQALSCEPQLASVIFPASFLTQYPAATTVEDFDFSSEGHLSSSLIRMLKTGGHARDVLILLIPKLYSGLSSTPLVLRRLSAAVGSEY
jgi:hypothetical protein